jgi:uncharacterized protein YqeY
MAELIERLQQDMNAARKAQDRAAVTLLGTIIADARNREIELRRDLTDDDVVEVLRRGIKKRRESAEMYEKGGRTDLASAEKQEAELLGRYLPAAVDPEEVRAAIREVIAGGNANMGQVMGAIMSRFKGRVEGGAINAMVREELSRKG